MISVPDDLTDECVHEQLAHLYVVRIFKNFGEQEFFDFVCADMHIRFLSRLIYFYLQLIEFCL